MESLEFNKIAGAGLGTLLFVVALTVVTDGMFSGEVPAKPGYDLPSAAKEEAVAAKAPEAKAEPLPVLLASADPKKGEADTAACKACHNFEKGASAKIGPPLYGVLGRPKGSVAGFDYSAGLKGKGGNWTFADLNEFILKPSAYVSGTKMSYPGEQDAKKRAEIVRYLDTLSDHPEPLPSPDAPVTPVAVKETPTKTDVPATAKPAAQADAKPAAQADAKPAAPAAAPAPATPAQAQNAPAATKIGVGDAEAGKADVTVCKTCHNFEKGAGAKIGPGLYGVVGRDKGSFPGYEYSAGLKGKGGKWTPEDINQFITKPAEYVPGTKMLYPGQSSAKKRADIIAYLESLKDGAAAPAK